MEDVGAGAGLDDPISWTKEEGKVATVEPEPAVGASVEHGSKTAKAAASSSLSELTECVCLYAREVVDLFFVRSNI